MTISDRDVGIALAQAIRQRIGEPRYALWFERRTTFRWDDGHLTVGVPNLHFQEWLQKKFGEAVQGAAVEVFAQPVEVHFLIDPGLFQAVRQEQVAVTANALPTPAEGVSPPAPPGNKEGAQIPRPPRRSRRWHRLSDFVVGPCNRVAHASAVSVVEEPGQGANPLVLHGPTGTGKTHLLEGIYVGLRRTHPEGRVCYVTAEDFTNRFLQAMRLGKLSIFRKQFRDCDALLVDDLHFLASKKATQEEFLHTFDTLLAGGGQLVVACDCHPRLAEEFTPEMTDRLLGGAVWGLTPPDRDTRLAILQSRAAAAALLIPEEVLALLAARLRGNVRELEGALHSLRHFSRVTGRPIDLDLAQEALADLLRHAVRVVHLNDVETAVCQVLRLEAGVLQGKGRSWAVSHPRMLAMYLARKHTSAAYADIGRHFGGRNHSTVVAAEKKVRQWLQDDGALILGERRLQVREVVEKVERELFR